MTAVQPGERADTDAGGPVLEIRNAVKRFGPVLALDGVSLTLAPGETLALLGDNGAGKSTLVKAISGVHTLDGGEMLLDGRPVSFSNPTEAREAGIETVYQDLALFDNLNIASNFFAGRERTRPSWLGSLGFLRERLMLRETSDILERLEVNVPDPRALVGMMSGGQRQAIAVARAVAFGRKIIILDEPTAALGARESRNVLRLVKRLPEEGLSVILISHNLEQVMQVAHRAVVFRRGRYVGERVPAPDTHEELVSMIVGGGTLEQAGEPDDEDD
jgi:D-xylose transport system ATP-binding protein